MQAALQTNQADLTRLQSAAAYARANAQRVANLFKQGILAEDQNDMTQANPEQTDAQLRAAEARLRQSQAQLEQTRAQLEQARAQVEVTRGALKQERPTSAIRPFCRLSLGRSWRATLRWGSPWLPPCRRPMSSPLPRT